MPVIVAGFWRRLGAFSIDMAILGVTAGPLHYLLTLLVPGTELAPGSSGLDAMFQIVTADVGHLLGRVAPFLIMAMLYFGLFWAISGRTLGQTLLRVRVIGSGGERPKIVAAVVRLAAAVVGLLPGALGSIWMAFDMEKRAFHDHVAGTYVVRDS